MKYFKITSIDYKNGINDIGICGRVFERGIYLSITEVINDYKVEYNHIILFSNNINHLKYLNEDEKNFKNKLESYLLKNKDLSKILKFKKYCNSATPEQLEKIKYIYIQKYKKGV